MTFSAIVLGGIVLFCWVGVLGMWRMKEPVQAIHYLSLPATGGSFLLLVGVAISTGFKQAFLKTLLIMAILWASNSVVSHATARAFRSRELGHWEPLPGDPMERVREEKKA